MRKRNKSINTKIKKYSIILLSDFFLFDADFSKIPNNFLELYIENIVSQAPKLNLEIVWILFITEN